MARDHRRLAAIVSLDVAGYSRLMGVDDSGTLAALKAHRRELIDPKIAEHDGRIVKTTGDGLLLEFSSVVDAVRCAVEIQEEINRRKRVVRRKRNVDSPQNRDDPDVARHAFRGAQAHEPLSRRLAREVRGSADRLETVCMCERAR